MLVTMNHKSVPQIYGTPLVIFSQSNEIWDLGNATLILNVKYAYLGVRFKISGWPPGSASVLPRTGNSHFRDHFLWSEVNNSE